MERQCTLFSEVDAIDLFQRDNDEEALNDLRKSCLQIFVDKINEGEVDLKPLQKYLLSKVDGLKSIRILGASEDDSDNMLRLEVVLGVDDEENDLLDDDSDLFEETENEVTNYFEYEY